MMMSSRVLNVVAAFVFAAASAAAAQAQPPAGGSQAQPPAGTQATKPPAVAPAPAPARAAAPPPAAARGAATLMVTDQSGSSLADVHVKVTGPVDREGTTGRDGVLRLQALKPGTYRMRFSSPDFITLERETTIKVGPPAEIDVALDRAPPRPAEPSPSQSQTSARVSGTSGTIAADPNATAESVGLPDWIEKNLIGRNDPLKETVVGHTAAATATVVQVREPVKDKVRSDADEMLYVIAGDGVLRSKGHELTLDAGALVVLPRGVSYSIERKGRNPLIALSIVTK
jgi:mannose-6-phosphate isomerase-like protein (cupin superfamily)